MTRLPAITELVPHAPPMLALEELLDADDDRARARLTVREEAWFVVDGRMDAVCSLELIAQAVAASIGLQGYRAGEDVRVGMVVACRSLTLEVPAVPVGADLVVTVHRVRGTEWMSNYEGDVATADGVVVARASVTLVHGGIRGTRITASP